MARSNAPRFTTEDCIYNQAWSAIPFGLQNAPVVFQHLMQQILTGLNQLGGPDYVFVHLDDILVFSPSLEDQPPRSGPEQIFISRSQAQA